jgi:hypothetical protein
VKPADTRSRWGRGQAVTKIGVPQLLAVPVNNLVAIGLLELYASEHQKGRSSGADFLLELWGDEQIKQLLGPSAMQFPPLRW